MGISKNSGGFTPPNHPIFNRIFHYKPSILGVPLFLVQHPHEAKGVFKRKPRRDACAPNLRNFPQWHVLKVLDRWIMLKPLGGPLLWLVSPWAYLANG